jgi:hypothetical protein
MFRKCSVFFYGLFGSAGGPAVGHCESDDEPATSLVAPVVNGDLPQIALGYFA